MFSPPKYYVEPPSTAKQRPKFNILGNLYQCDFCSEGWQSETEIDIHRTLEHSYELDDILRDVVNNPACFICIKKHPDVPSLLRHVKSDHLLSSETARRIERKIFICDYCCQVFFNREMIIVHLLMAHQRNTRPLRLECPKCSRKVRHDGLWSHFEFHQIQSVASCPICLTKFRDRKARKEHIKTHVSYLNCAICNYETRNIENYEKHLDMHGQVNESIDYLPVHTSLIKYFAPKRNVLPWKYLYSRMTSFNGLTLPGGVHICVLCREICTTVNHMIRHISSHETVRQKKKLYSCTCGEKFSNNVLLKHHIFKLKGDHKVKGN